MLWVGTSRSAATVLGAVAAHAGATEDPAGSETTTERLARLVREYDAQGMHRTGTEVDQASARWLSAEAARAGFAAELEALPFSRVDVRAAYLEIDGKRLDGVPLLDSPPTGPAGIEGTLGALGGGTAVAFARVAPSESLSPEFWEARRARRHRALVAITGGAPWQLAEGYSLINADHYREPYGPPVLQLPSQAWKTLDREWEVPPHARLVIDSARSEHPVYNVTVTVPGTLPGLAPLVVMTPRSGWFECAAERGGGLALWVELLYVLRRDPPERTVHFVASTGHELGHLGLEHYLASRSELVAGARAWLHLGANFAAAHGAELRLQASDAELLDLARQAMGEAGVPADVVTPADARPLGEARNIFDGAGRFLSLLGRNGRFHSPADRWPEAVDLDRLTRLGAAFTTIVTRLASEREEILP